MITGGVGQAVASPTDVVKVRLQADGRLKAVGKAPRYKVSETRWRLVVSQGLLVTV
jgi:solute carrier family 25 uncoupling protein 27